MLIGDLLELASLVGLLGELAVGGLFGELAVGGLFGELAAGGLQVELITMLVQYTDILRTSEETMSNDQHQSSYPEALGE